MKLNTSIPPRRDGSVKVTSPAGNAYEFKADAEGELACEVADEADLAWMLGTQHFYPADVADTSQAVALVQANTPPAEDEDADDEEEDDDGAEVVNGGLPVEANTPPARKKPGPKPKAK